MKRNVLHIIVWGNTGGIEILCNEYCKKSENNNIVALLWGRGNITDKMKMEGISVVECGLHKWDIVGAIYKLNKVCDQYNIDTIIVQHGDPISHFLIMQLSIIKPRIPIIVYAHANAIDIVYNKNWLKRKLSKTIIVESFHRANKVIAISEFVKKSIVNEFGVESTKIDVVYNGIDTSKFYQTRTNLNYPVQLIYVGRLLDVKGVQFIIEALSLLDYKNYFLRIIGEGKYRTELENLVLKYGLNNAVKFEGLRSNVNEYLTKADIFIHVPKWEEGFGITIIEALASGVVCICGRKGAIPEIIDDKVDGFIVESNPVLLANKIKEISNMNENELITIKKNAVKKAMKFSIEKYTENIDGIIKDLGEVY